MSAAEEIAGYRVHPIASMFPLIEGRAFDELVEDIREHGLREPVVVADDGVLLDGRNRVRACEAAGVEIVEDVHGGSDVAGFIVSHNLHRRHLTDAQRAMIAARMANLPTTGGRPPKTSPIGDVSPEPAVTRSTAKDLMQVSEGSLHRAKVITEKAIPEVADMATQGHVSLDAGSRVAALPREEQEKFVADVKAGTPVSEAAPKPAPKVRANPKPKSDDSSLTRPQPPKFGGNRKKHAQILESVAISLQGLAMVADEITEFDASVTDEEAVRLADDLSKSIRSLNRIKQNLYRKATP